MSRIYADSPICGGSITPDKLNRTEYAKRLAKSLILEPENQSFVISIEAPWGHGKTSMLNLIEKEFRQNEHKTLLFKFNPWLIGSQEQLLRDFFTQFASTLGLADSAKKYQRAAKAVCAYSKLLSFCQYLPNEWGIAAGIAGKATASLGCTLNAISDLKKLNIEEQKQKVIDTIKDLHVQIVIFIDDLDRLLPEEIYEMLRAVKAISVIPRIVIVMAFERQYITDALEKYNISNPGQYLNKIIQVSLTLPPINQLDLGVIIADAFNSLISDDLFKHFPEDQKRFRIRYEMSLRPLLKSVREVNQVFNKLRFSATQLAGEVAFTDLFCLEVIAVKAPDIYDLIVRCPECFTINNIFRLDDENRKKTEDVINEKLDKLLLSERNNISDILKYLFPKVYYDSKSLPDNSTFERDGKVACHRKLLIALSHDMPTGNIPMSEVRAFCNGTLSASEIVKNSEDAIAFLDELIVNIDTIDIYNHEKFISNFNNFVCSEELYKDRTIQSNWYGLDIYSKCFSVIEKLLRKDKSKLAECTNLIFSDPEFFILGPYMIDEMQIENGLFREQDIMISVEDINSYKNKWTDYFKIFVEDRSILNYGNINRIIWTYWQISGSSPNNIDFTPLLTPDSDLDKFIEAFVGFGSSSVNGEFARSFPELRDYILGEEILNNRIRERLEVGCKEPRLRAIYLSVRDNAEYFTVDCTRKNN